MKLPLWRLASCLLAASASACTEVESPLSPGAPAATSVTEPARSGASRSTEVFEWAFIEGMIDRQTVSVRIAASCAGRAVREQLRRLCEETRATRSQELVSLASWLAEWYGAEHEPRTMPREARSLERLASLTAEAYEIELMAVMTDNLERAVKEARHCDDKAGRSLLIAFCADLIESHRAAVARMGTWLCAWHGICGRASGGTGEMVVALNSFDRSLTFFSVDEPGRTETMGLPGEGYPIGVSVRGGTLVVSSGDVLVLVDAQARAPLGVVALPPGASAAGSAFLNDSIVLVTNSRLNSLSVVNVRRQALVGVIEAAGFDWPRAVAVHDGLVFVANAMFGGDYWMDGPGTVTVLDAGTLAAVKTVALSGWSALSLTVGPDDRIWVLNSGEVPARGPRGSLSVIDPSTLEEVEYHPGFGYLPTGLAWSPGGLAHVASSAYGLAVWDPVTDRFVRPPDQAVAPDGVPSASAVGFDGQGRLYALQALSCEAPGFVYRLSPAYRVEARVGVGVCPSALGFVGPDF